MNAALIDDLLTLFRRHDPMGLRAPGMPPDEYRPEVEAVVADLPLLDDRTQVRPLLHTVMQAYFAPLEVGPEEAYTALSDEVWASWKRHG